VTIEPRAEDFTLDKLRFHGPGQCQPLEVPDWTQEELDAWWSEYWEHY
jgi:hypothetical protein